jgi:hypothetical protein
MKMAKFISEICNECDSYSNYYLLVSYIYIYIPHYGFQYRSSETIGLTSSMGLFMLVILGVTFIFCEVDGGRSVFDKPQVVKYL